MDSDELTLAKASLRRSARAHRRAQADKDALSEAAWRRLCAIPGYAEAGTVMMYVHIADELRTRAALGRALHEGKRVVVPFCNGKRLGLWKLDSLDELVPGRWDIPEPPPARWFEPARVVRPRELELVVVPGVAFDAAGRRLGNGGGFYDRLLVELDPATLRVGICFECQLFADLPVGVHDAPVQLVVTERATYAP